jgi:hypothetical protein
MSSPLLMLPTWERDYVDKFFSSVTTTANRCLMELDTIHGSPPSDLQDLALIV